MTGLLYIDTATYGGLTANQVIGFATGDLVVNGKIVANDILVELDSGAATVVGQTDAVTSGFNETGIQGVLQSTPDRDLLTGYFACDKPPTRLQLPCASNFKAADNDNRSAVSKAG